MSTPAEMRAQTDKSVAEFNKVIAVLEKAIAHVAAVREALVASTALEIEKQACEANPGRETFIRVMAIREEMAAHSKIIMGNNNAVLFTAIGLMKVALEADD